MIITAILTILYFALRALISPLLLLPNASLPPEIGEAISSVGGKLAAIDMIIPVDTILAILGSFIAIEAAIFVYKTIMWVIKKIPTIN